MRRRNEKGPKVDDPEKIEITKREKVFASLMVPTAATRKGGKPLYGVRTEMLHPDAPAIFRLYCDRRGNKGSDNPDAIKAAEAFRKATGYEAEELRVFVLKFNGYEPS